MKIQEVGNGVELEGEWTKTRLNNIATKIKGTKPEEVTEEPADGLEPYITAEAFEGEINSYADPESGKRCYETDVLLVWDGSVGKVLKGFNGILGSTMAALRFDEDKVDPRFAYYYLYEHREQIAALSEGTTILHVPKDFMEIFEIPIPPIDIQTQIADFLDLLNNISSQTSTIQEEIRHLKRGAINKVLRRGLDNHQTKEVRFGPVQREIPKKWEVKSLEEVTLKGKNGLRGGPPGGKIKKEVRTDSGYKIYVQENIINRDFDIREDYIPESEYQNLGSVSTHPGDILVTTEGSIGRAAVLPDDAQDGIINNHLARLRVDQSRYSPNYIAEVIDASDLVKSQITSLSNNSGRPGINLKIVKQIEIPIPSYREQVEISNLFDSIDSKMEKEAMFSDEIDSLKEGVRGQLLEGNPVFTNDK